MKRPRRAPRSSAANVRTAYIPALTPEPRVATVSCPLCHRSVEQIDDGITRRLIGHWPRSLTWEETTQLLAGKSIGLRVCAGPEGTNP